MKNTVMDNLKKHTSAIVLAFAIGAVVVMPQFWFIAEMGENYAGFNIFETDAEYYYITRVRDVYDGHLAAANPVLLEGKDLPYVQPSLPEIIMAAPMKLFGLGIGETLILFRFIGPILLFFLIYGLTLGLTRGNRFAALTAPVVIILASDLVSFPTQILGMFDGTFQAKEFVNYARPVNPQISSLFFFGFLYAFWRHVTKPARNLLAKHNFFADHKYLLASITTFGLSFYVYPYTWSFILGFLILYAIISWWQKNKPRLRGIFIIIGTGLLISIPYFVNSFNVVNHFDYTAVTTAYGMYESHEAVFSSILLLSLVLLSVYYVLSNKKTSTVVASGAKQSSESKPKTRLLHSLKSFAMTNDDKYKEAFWFLLPLIVTGIVVINQQIITGQILYYGHYHWYMNKPLGILIGFLVLFFLLKKYKLNVWLQGSFVLAVIGVSFFNAYHVQQTSYDLHKDKYIEAQKYEDVIAWLNINTTKNDVVYVPGAFFYPGMEPTSRLLPKFILTYTPLNMYYYSEAHFYLSPYLDYGRHNMYLTMKLIGVGEGEGFEYMQQNPRIFKDVLMNYFKVRDLDFTDLPAETIAEAAEEYEEFAALPDEDIWNSYPVDYVVWDKIKAPEYSFDTLLESGLIAEVYNDKDIVVYAFDETENLP